VLFFDMLLIKILRNCFIEFISDGCSAGVILGAVVEYKTILWHCLFKSVPDGFAVGVLLRAEVEFYK
jgi:hypothetical protein